MAQPEQLTQPDQAMAGVADPLPIGSGAFGHVRQRRLGLRIPVHCWALLSGSTSSAYAVAVELSPTGVVLELVGRHARLMSRAGQLFRLDLFIPGAKSTVSVAVRRVRYIGQREAFELAEVSGVDRLTLAEYLDRMTAKGSAASFTPRTNS